MLQPDKNLTYSQWETWQNTRRTAEAMEQLEAERAQAQAARETFQARNQQTQTAMFLAAQAPLRRAEDRMLGAEVRNWFGQF